MDPHTSVSRLETFCDGVFAIAITLLIIDIRTPPHEAVGQGGLAAALLHEWPSYAAYLLSFAVIGIMWANHHNIFRYIARANHVFLMLNVLLMLCTAFLPYPTAVLAAYLPVPSERTTAALFYGATLTATAVVYNVVWRYAAHGRRLLKAEADQRLVDAVTREYSFGPVTYAVATALALLSVAASLAVHAALALLYVVPTKARP